MRGAFGKADEWHGCEIVAAENAENANGRGRFYDEASRKGAEAQSEARRMKGSGISKDWRFVQGKFPVFGNGDYPKVAM
jgi:hypothetical protein